MTRRYIKFITAATAVAVVLNFAWFGVYTFVNAFVVRQLGQSNADWTQASLCFLGGLLAGQILCTEIARRIGRRGTVAMALIVASVGYMLLGIADSMPFVYLSLVLLGLVPAVLLTIWMAMVAEFGGQRPGKAIAEVMFVNSVIGAAVLALASILGSGSDYARLFLVMGLTSLVALAFFLPASAGLESSTPRPVVSLLRLDRSAVCGILTRQFFLVLLAGFCAEAFLSLTMNQLFPNLGRDVAGLSERTIGNIVAAGRLPALVCLFAMRLVIDRVKPHLCYGIGLVGAALLVILTGAVVNSAGLVCGYLAFYLVYGVIWSANIASLNASVDTKFRDPAFAVASTAAVVSIVVAGGLHRGLLGAEKTLPFIFMVCGLIGIAGGCILILSAVLGHKPTAHGQAVIPRMVSIYALKPAFQGLLMPICRTLRAMGVTPNQVTVAAALLSTLVGFLIFHFRGASWTLLLLPGFLFLRMALNAIDGMLAREYDMKTRLGAVLNEVGDIYSDTVLYLPLVVVKGFSSHAVVAIVLLAAISELVGLAAARSGASRRFDGPMGKSDRAFMFGLMGLLTGLNAITDAWLRAVLWLTVALLVVTIANRIWKAHRELRWQST